MIKMRAIGSFIFLSLIFIQTSYAWKERSSCEPLLDMPRTTRTFLGVKGLFPSSQSFSEQNAGALLYAPETMMLGETAVNTRLLFVHYLSRHLNLTVLQRELQAISSGAQNSNHLNMGNEPGIIDGAETVDLLSHAFNHRLLEVVREGGNVRDFLVPFQYAVLLHP
jgi:hypothetical protein